MDPHAHPTTPFGRRTLTLAHLGAEAMASLRPPEKAVHKWNVFHDVCAARAALGLSERALAVLDALLSFHPETVLTGEGLIVFPSNAQLALRAHGMAPATLRRHLAGLVDAGVIVRRDSPNGKRYARKGRGGEVECAFGFDLGPLVVRAEEFAARAEEARAAERAQRRARERVTLLRRDIVKLIATGIEQDAPPPRLADFGQGMARGSGEGETPAGASVFGAWAPVHAHFRAILARLPRAAGLEALEGCARDLAPLAAESLKALQAHANIKKKSANESQTERHKQNSNPQYISESEPAFQESRAENIEAKTRLAALAKGREKPESAIPLAVALRACPDLADYAKGGIASWADFQAAARLVRPMLGVSPSAWEDACAIMGEGNAAIALAGILQRADAITSPGGYLRALTQKARENQFSVGPMLMALVAAKERRGAA